MRNNKDYNNLEQLNLNIEEPERNCILKIGEYDELREEVVEIENMEKWDEEACEFYLDFLKEFDESFESVETYRDKNTGKGRFRYKINKGDNQDLKIYSEEYSF